MREGGGGRVGWERKKICSASEEKRQSIWGLRTLSGKANLPTRHLLFLFYYTQFQSMSQFH